MEMYFTNEQLKYLITQCLLVQICYFPVNFNKAMWSFQEIINFLFIRFLRIHFMNFREKVNSTLRFVKHRQKGNITHYKQIQFS